MVVYQRTRFWSEPKGRYVFVLYESIADFKSNDFYDDRHFLIMEDI